MKSYVNSYLLDYLGVNVDTTYRKVKVDREEKNNFEILEEIELEKKEQLLSALELDKILFLERQKKKLENS